MNHVKVSISQHGHQLAYPKNLDVKDIRPSLADRIDLFAHKFPGETAFYFGAAAIVVVCVANMLVR